MKEKRFLILPMDGTRLSDAPEKASSSARHLLDSLRTGSPAKVKKLGAQLTRAVAASAKKGTKLAARSKGVQAVAGGLEIIKSLGEDSVKLVRASEEVVTALRQQNPGIRVIEETFCRPALAPRAFIPRRIPAAAGTRRAGTAAAAAIAPIVVQVVRADDGQPVRGAEVIAFRTNDDALKAKTNAAGKATFKFGSAAKSLKRLYVYHEEPGLWGYFKTGVAVVKGEVRAPLAAIDLKAVDSLRHFHRAGALGDGTGVRVGVIDSGADTKHPDLAAAIAGGANCVPESSRAANDYGPAGPHGTHVAGIIAGRGKAPTGVRGVAPGAQLYIYRVFEDKNEGSGSSFAVIDAIERAIADRCDIINMSLGFDQGVTDGAISSALRKARNHGILAVAAAGNDGRLPVNFPGSDSTCVAVAAAGRKGLFPPTATEAGDVAPPFGSDPLNFIAGFSNIGSDLDVAGAGVGVVSTVPGGYGAMSGTSMASPAVAGMAARLLSGKPALLAKKRDAERSDEIRKLLIDAAKPLGFGILLEGAGLPR